MTKNAVLKSSNVATLVLTAAWLALIAGQETATAQSTGAKLAEPATVEEAVRVLDLRTFPRIEGAQVSSLYSLGMLMYSAKGTPKDAFEFQKRELEKRGFKELPGRNSYAGGESSYFTKDGFHVAVSAHGVSGNPEQVGWSQVTLVNSGNVALDKLPVPPGAKPFHPSQREASYTTSASPKETADACRKLLLAAGWEPYGELPPSPNSPDSSEQHFKRNAIELKSWIMTTPAEGGKTLIRYSTDLLSADLPAPADATNLRYDDWQKNLTFNAPPGQSDAVIAFYQQRLAKQGWQPTTERPIVDDRRKTKFHIYRNLQKDLLSLNLDEYGGKLAVRLTHRSAAEVAEEERLANAEAEQEKKELEARNAPVKVAMLLPAGAQKLKKKGGSELEFSLRTGSGPATLQRWREHFREDGWTEKRGRDFGKTSGILILEKGYARLMCSYFDLGISDVDIKVEGTQNVVLETAASQDKPLAEAPPAAAPLAARPPAAAPAIPGLPALPPGVELPDDVKALLNQALQEAGKAAAPATKVAPAKAAPAKTPPAKTARNAKGPPGAKAPAAATPQAAKQAVAVAAQSVPAAKTFRRVATETSLGSIAQLDLSKRDNNKPDFFVSPDGRRFAYLIEKKGIVIDGKEYLYPNMYQGGVKERTFRFSPDSRHTAYVAYVGEQGDTLVIDGVPEKRGWNFIDHNGAVFSPDSQHIAYIARRYKGGDVEYALVIDGKDREVFKESPAWSMSFTADGRRVVWGEDVEKRTLMRETSVDGSEPRIDRTHGPALMTINFFFGGGGQMGYVAKEGPEKFFVFYDGKEEKYRSRDEIKRRNIVLSDDGKHLAYIAEPAQSQMVVVHDGQPGKVFHWGSEGDIVDGSLAISPDGRRVAYSVRNFSKHRTVIDGREGKIYQSVKPPVFSPDSKRVAYLAAGAGKAMAVVDGQEISGYDTVGEPVFSPDSKSVAFWAEAAKRQYLVLNGQKQKAYDDVDTPWFSPDGKRLVYIAQVGDKSLLVENGKEQKPYDNINGQLYFSADGRHLAAVVLDGDQDMVVVDGVEGNRYDMVFTSGGGKVYFDSADRFHYLATKGDELFLVEETIQP